MAFASRRAHDAEVSQVVGDCGDTRAEVLLGQHGRHEFDDRGDVGEYPDMAARATGVAAKLLVELLRLI
jgi:hypothetical protein